nr:immunoglobulin-like and fibronectin type III domain-containing protein 1 [Nothobranchius furzeri]
MWKRSKNASQPSSRSCFSLVHQYILHFNEVSGNKSAVIRRRSKTPGVMITQSIVNLPEGKSTPDFQCKPIPVTVQEGKPVVFKAVVTGSPKPDVTWKRAKGNLSDKEKFLRKCKESTGEYILEIRNVTAAEADTYKCCAVNEYGKAVCSTTLTVVDGSTNPEDFRKLLKKSKLEKADGENDERFWDAMLNADRKDYERICSEYDVSDLHLILKKLEDKRKARGQNYEDEDDCCDDDSEKSGIRRSGRTNAVRINNVLQNDSGLHMADVGEINLHNKQLKEAGPKEDLLPKEFKLSNVGFVIRIQEITAEEKDHALFECVLTHPLSTITWMKKGIVLEDGEKYNITVSGEKLIHRLLIKDCNKMDKGIYSAIAGITSCSAWLVVEAQKNSSVGKKTVRKSALASGAETDLETVAKEQQIKNQQEMEKILKAVKAKQAAGKLKEEKVLRSGEDLNENRRPSKILEGHKERTLDDLESTAEDGKKPKEGGSKNKKPINICKDFNKVEEFSDEDDDEDDGDQHQLPTTSQHESSKDEDLTKNVRTQRKSKKVHWKRLTLEQNEQVSEDESGDTDDIKDSAEPREQQSSSKQCKESKEPASGKHLCHESHSECDVTEDMNDSSTQTRRKRHIPLITDSVIDPGVHFISGLSDVDAIIHEPAELTCKLSSEDCEGTWFRDGKKIFPDDSFSITKDGPVHKLMILKCEEEHSGKYRFEADGRKTEARFIVKDPPRFDPEDLNIFIKPLAVKVGHHAIFKLQFVGYKPIKIQWYRDGEELQEDNNIKIEKSAGHSRLLLIRCQRRDTGEIKIKLKNDHGFAEAISQLIVLDKPSAPLGPAEVMESSATCIELKWRPPKDDGGSPVISYILERQQVGRNTWKKIGEIPGVPSYRDTDVDRGRKYCYRIRAVTSEGTSDEMETDDMQAGKFAFPGPPAPPKVVGSLSDCITLSWAPPTKTGGSRILGYILEKRKKGSNLWTVANASDELVTEKRCAVRDVVEGIEYEFRVCAINLSGAGEFSNPSEFVFARDPKKPPGKVMGLKVTETSHTNMILTWTKPEEKPGEQDEAKGYFVEIRQADCLEWSRCNSSPVIMTSFNVKGLKSMGMYWVRVIAMNDGGESAPEELPRYVLAVPLPVRPRFTNTKMKSFMVVRAGNSVRVTVNFEASPRPETTWLKDNVPVTKRATVSNSDGSSQLLIPSSERSDSGIYSVLLKNFAGQETFSTEVRVTDDPNPPGPVELEENVPGTVTVIWTPSPDEKLDDRLHYTVLKLDSNKHTWTTVADRLFNNKFTVCNILQGREYHFRVYAKNDMGTSAPSESPTWGKEKKKNKMMVTEATCKACDLRCAPTFIVPLKLQTATVGYECHMSCAVKGNPAPRVTWYRNHVSLNTDTNYYISNTCGVCSLLILRVGPKDTGEYSVVAENSLGRAECTTVISVRE